MPPEPGMILSTHNYLIFFFFFSPGCQRYPAEISRSVLVKAKTTQSNPIKPSRLFMTRYVEYMYLYIRLKKKGANPFFHNGTPLFSLAVNGTCTAPKLCMPPPNLNVPHGSYLPNLDIFKLSLR